MSNTELICHFCEAVIARPQENWGQWNSPTCLRCYTEMSAICDHEPQESWYGVAPEDFWYGLAPHTYDLTLTSSFIGCTVMTPLPALTQGLLALDYGWGWFEMDKDDPWLGIYCLYGPNEPTDGGQLEMTALLTAEAATGETT